MDHVIMNHGQVTWTTPEFAPPSPNYLTTPTGGQIFSLAKKHKQWLKCSNAPMLFRSVNQDIADSDEGPFWLNGYVNKQNCRIWSEANPQVYVETPLHPEKLTVWCALWDSGIIGPYFFKNDEGQNVTVNGDRYTAMITNFFIPELNNHDVQELWLNKTAQHVTQLVPQLIF
ncbi:uncharacterized protein TNCV_3402561 [Trichonephila clavipes]|nr:uncharacterized protein TNCV_3402561 [Trichonephila clavipes]